VIRRELILLKELDAPDGIEARNGTNESNVEYVKPNAWRFSTSLRYLALATTVAW
jgi:hypothetical protein